MFAAVLAAYATTRLNIPILIGFLGLGMLLGSDGPGGIAFSDAHLARVVGVLCLAAILFEGGLTTDRRHVREVALPALSLGTLGVLVTAGVCALAARSIFGLSTSSALLLGAVVGSTDAAAVFTTLRRVGLPDRLSVLLSRVGGQHPWRWRSRPVASFNAGVAFLRPDRALRGARAARVPAPARHRRFRLPRPCWR